MVQFILTKKSQVWAIDLAIAFIIFLAAILLFFKYSINLSQADSGMQKDLVLNAKLVSANLVSAGYPEDWDMGNVTTIGLTDGNTRLSLSKIEQFDEIARLNYSRSRTLLSSIGDYSVCFQGKNRSIAISGVSCIGKDIDVAGPENIVKVTRFVFYNSSVIKIEVKVW